MPISSLEPFLKELIDSNVDSPYPYSVYIDIYEENAKQNNSTIHPSALQMCTNLAEKYDTIREKYWNHRKRLLEKIGK